MEFIEKDGKPLVVKVSGEMFLKDPTINVDDVDYITPYLEKVANLNGCDEALPYTFIEVRDYDGDEWFSSRERFYMSTSDGNSWTCQVPSVVPVSCVKNFKEGEESELVLLGDAWDSLGRSCKFELQTKVKPIQSQISGQKFEDMLNEKIWR